MITRRGVLKAFGLAAMSGLTLGGYAFGLEPFRLHVQRYAFTPPRWPQNLHLRIAAIADIHACEPWMSADRIRAIVDRTNALSPDLILLLGDYVAGHPWVTNWVHSKDWSAAMAALSSPLGVHAILGNHDWWEDKTAQKRGTGPVFGRSALENVGIPVYENDVVKLQKNGESFWLAGLGDQLALLPGKKWGRARFQGMDDLPGALSKITDDAPIILLAHEPDIFPKVPDRVSLTLSGHTHGGQIRIMKYSPVVPSRYGNRYAYGHIVETGSGPTQLIKLSERPRHMIVSGGLGCSIAPIRLGVPPEIVLIELGVKS